MKSIKIIFFSYITLKICNFNSFQDINFVGIFIEISLSEYYMQIKKKFMN